MTAHRGAAGIAMAVAISYRFWWDVLVALANFEP